MAVDHQTKVALLSRLEWFASLPREDLDSLADAAGIDRWSPGQVVFEEGEQGSHCYLLHGGAVRVVRYMGDGRRILLATLGPGSVFGELALLNGEQRTATVEAVEPSVALRLGADDVMPILRREPSAALALAVGLAQRLRAANERAFDHALSTVSGRVAATLLSQLEARRAQGGGDQDIEVAGSPSDIAKLAGTSRIEAVRLLHWLENEEIVTLKRGRIVIHDPGSLGKYLR